MSAIAILHPGTLAGKELRETLDKRLKSWRDVRLLSTDTEEAGLLTEVQGAAAIVQRYEPDSLKGVSTVYFCGPAAVNRPLYADVPPGAVTVVLSPDATLEDGVPVVAGVSSAASAASAARLVSPHPAVVLLAHLLHPLRPLQPVDLVATLIQPASAQGNPGVEELFDQTREIVAMTGRRTAPVYGAQLAFNLLPAADDSLPLSDLLQKVLSEMELPPVPLQILQGGVFHGMALSLHARFGGSPTPKSLRKALTANPYVEMAEDPKHLGPIDSGSSDKVLVGAIRKDASSGGFWFWAVMDNLTRGTALNAVEIAEAAGGSDSATLNRGAWEKLVGIGGEALFPPEETVKQIRIRKTRA
jgi:aspartate-semialdehyde dehydrogenase